MRVIVCAVAVLALAARLAFKMSSQVVAMIDSTGVNTVVDVLSRWGAAAAHSNSLSVGGAALGLSSNVAAIRAAAAKSGAPLAVKDPANFLATMRMIAISHYLKCDQLMELMSLLPYHDNFTRVELLCIFWARTVDKAEHWTDVLRKLTEAGQIMAAQRLGYCNIFNPKRPSLHYRLRMFRPDEHEIAWQLFNMAVEAPQECFSNTTIDGEPKKMNEGSSIWPVMRGSAKDGTPPTCTIEFDFTWPEKTGTESKAVHALKMALRANKEAKSGVPSGGEKPKFAKAKLVANPLRKSVAKPKKPEVVVSSPKAGKMTPLEKELAEGVVLTKEGRLRRLMPQGAMKFFTRIYSGQASSTAARNLWERDDIKEDLGTFGYYLSNAGGLLLDRALSTRLHAPRLALAQGKMPGGLEATPWDDTAMPGAEEEEDPGVDGYMGDGREWGEDKNDSRPGTSGSMLDRPSSPTSASRRFARGASRIRNSLRLDALDDATADAVLLGSPGPGARPVSASMAFTILEGDGDAQDDGEESPSTARLSFAGGLADVPVGRVSMPGSPSKVGNTTAILTRMATLSKVCGDAMTGPSPRSLRIALTTKTATHPTLTPAPPADSPHDSLEAGEE